ncbi:MAG: hypothetical protein J0L84_06630 [Verrucomicrobia bacterium]|nr:hypothetical protein [Verrucomicrobiota bacterium]
MKLLSSIPCAVVLGLVLLGTRVVAADVAGEWTWSTPGRDGGAERKSTLTLKVDAGKLSGKISSPGRDGAAVETAISDAKLDGDSIAFSVVREFNGNSFTRKYSGKVAGDTITGKTEFDRNGETQSRDWVAKRTAPAK